MTELRINLAAFSKACRRVREERFPENEEGFAAKRNYYREDYDFRTAVEHLVRPSKALSADEKIANLRAELVSASVAAGQYGATEAQINYIVALSEKSGDFNILSGGRLTKQEASRIIDQMKREGAA